MFTDYELTNDLPNIEPKLYGKIGSSNFGVGRSYDKPCNKSTTSSTIADSKNAFLQNQPDFHCQTSNASTYHMTVDLYAKLQGFDSVIKTINMYDYRIGWAYMQQTLYPEEMMTDKPYSITWYAPGIGVVKREIYDKNQLVDRIILTDYFIPK